MKEKQTDRRRLSDAELLQMKRWNTPTIYNGWEQITRHDHADKHGFLVVPPEDEARLLEAARFMDDNECRTMIAAARASAGKSTADILAEFDAAAAQFGDNTVGRFGHQGE